jgi:hypothetical protein
MPWRMCSGPRRICWPICAAAVDDERLLDGIDWLGPDYKRDSVSRWITWLMRDDPRHRDLLIRLTVDVGGMEDFSQLGWLEDVDAKTSRRRPPSSPR